jgi:predicted O-linked N-acetylglucosamine transferase (SPINDLY family)
LYEDVLRSEPNNFAARHHLGLIYCEKGEFLQGLRQFDRALKADPANADCHNNRGNALRELKRFGEALAAFDKAVALKPASAVSHCNRGNALRDLERRDEAIQSYDRALELQPDLAQAWANRGTVLNDLERLDEAIASYERAQVLNPNARSVFGELLFARLRLNDWRELGPSVERMAERIERGDESILPFVALATSGDPALHRKAAELQAQAFARRAGPPAPFSKKQARRDKIHVGYYSTDFHNHPMAYLMAEVYEQHDRTKFETTAFSFGPPKQDAMRQRLAKAFTRFIDVRHKSDAEIVALSRELKVDIAVDLTGYTQTNRTGIFAGRAAPVQASFLGYPGTMGAAFFDYIVADRSMIPDGAEAHYTEKIVRLPGSYQANDSKRAISDRVLARQDAGLGDTGFVFCCFNSSYKIQPATFESWMRILKAVPASRLWLFESHALAARNLRSEAAAHGVAEDRLVFAPPLPLGEHLARQRLADLFLDTLPYNAGTTASDALWAGLPVLTRTGQAMPGRVATSLLTALDLGELITTTAEDYEARAIELARSPDRLAAIKAKLARQRESSDLFKGERFARKIEAAYTGMHERHLKGLPPDHMSVRSPLS